MSDGPGRPPFRFADIAIPLVMLGTGAAATLVAAVGWLAGVLAADTHTVVPAPVWPILRAITQAAAAGSLEPLIGPAGSRPIFWTTTTILALLILAGGGVLVWWATRRLDRFGNVARSLGRARDYRDMRGTGARRRAVSLRPVAGRATGGGPRRHRAAAGAARASRPVRRRRRRPAAHRRAALEQNLRAGRARGAVRARPAHRHQQQGRPAHPHLRAARPGRPGVHLRPATHRRRAQTWWWNPLAEIRDVSDAHHLVAHFSHTVGAGHERADPYFTKGAERLLAQLCLAAAVSGHHLRDVQHWLATRSDTPVQLLRDADHHRVATALLGTLEAPPDQRGGLYETALTAIACLESEAVLRYVTPPATWQTGPRVGRIDQFDPWQFLTGYYLDGHGRPAPHDSLYLLTREGAGSAAPVVAALVDHLLRTTAAAATACGGRVDPPVRAVLDEAANICPIRNLPDLYSYFGSMSIQVLSFLQSYQQGAHIWGRAGMDKLWSAATVKLIGAGVHDPAFCEDLSRLIGDHDITTWTHQHGRHGHTSTATRPQRILSAADIARLTKTQAVLLSAGRKAGLIRLLPWYTEPDDTRRRSKTTPPKPPPRSAKPPPPHSARTTRSAASSPRPRAPARERHDRRRRHRADRRRRPVAGRPSRADAATRRPRATS